MRTRERERIYRSLNHNGPATHVVTRLVGNGSLMRPLLTTAELTQGYEHHPTQDFGRIRQFYANWNDWTEWECKEYLVGDLLAKMAQYQPPLVKRHSDEKWQLTPSGAKKFTESGNGVNHDAIRAVFYGNVRINHTPVEEEEVVPARHDPKRTFSTSLHAHIPDQNAWIEGIEGVMTKYGWNQQMVIEHALAALFREEGMEVPPLPRRKGRH